MNCEIIDLIKLINKYKPINAGKDYLVLSGKRFKKLYNCYEVQQGVMVKTIHLNGKKYEIYAEDDAYEK